MTYDELKIKWAEKKLETEGIPFNEVYAVGWDLCDWDLGEDNPDAGDVLVWIEYDSPNESDEELNGEFESTVPFLTLVRQIAELGDGLL